MTTPPEDSFQNSTRVKTGEAPSSLPVVAAHAPPPAAYQRAPTLMAGASAGQQGRVKVWSPNPWRQWGVVAAGGASFFLVFSPVYLPTLGPVLLTSFILASCLGALYRSRKLCYLTMDDAGIGITTNKGSRALKWSDISSATEFIRLSAFGVFVGGQDYPRILLQAPVTVEINLAGYNRREREEILALIVERAGLVQDPFDPKRYWRRPAPRLPATESSKRNLLEPDRMAEKWDLPARSDIGRTWLEPHRH